MIDNGAVMGRRGFCGAGLAAALGLAMNRAAAAGLIPAPVKFGLVSSLFRDYPAFLVLPVMSPFKAYVEELMGVKSVLSEGGDALELGRQLKDGEQHLGVFHGVEFAWAKQRYPKLEPLFIAVNVDPVLRAHLLVRKAGGFAGIDALKGKGLRTAARGREHCYLFLERRCTKPGVEPRKYFKITRAGETCENLDALAAGRTTAVLSDGVDWEGYQKTSPENAAKLTSLVSSEPLPCALVAHYGNALDQEMLTAFRVGMQKAHRNPKSKDMLGVMRITKFQDVPGNFNEQLVAAAKAYPPPVKG